MLQDHGRKTVSKIEFHNLPPLFKFLLIYAGLLLLISFSYSLSLEQNTTTSLSNQKKVINNKGENNTLNLKGESQNTSNLQNLRNNPNSTTLTQTPTITPTITPPIAKYLDIKKLHDKYDIPLDLFYTHDFEVATLSRVVDGDTIEVIINDDNYKVRYIGIDTPEIHQYECYALQAKQKNSELLNNNTIVLIKDVSQTDKYGRLLRYVFTKDTFINGELVLQGYAKTLTIPPDVWLADVLNNLQKQAQKEQKGLWNPNACKETTPTPTPHNYTYKKTTTKNNNYYKSNSQANSSCNGYTCSYNAYNCKDFSSHAQAQYVYECCLRKVGYDVHRLDGDHDGIACESLR